MDEKQDNVRVNSQQLKFNWNDPQILGVIAAIFVVILTIVLFSLYRRSKIRRSGVLLLGLSDAGKTVIFVRLVYDRFVETHTSVNENVGEYLADKATLLLVDVPGDERRRKIHFDAHKHSARAIVFVVDSLTVQKNIQDAAEFLYETLSDEAVRGNKTPVLIFCNKQDETMAKGAGVIRTLLEKEMNILRQTKTSQLDSIENTNSSVYLGTEGKTFEFSHLSQKIDFAEGNAASKNDEDDPDLQQLEEWLEKMA